MIMDKNPMFQDYKKSDPFYGRESEKYSNPLPSREYILQCLDELGEPVSSDKLMELFGLTTDDLQEGLRFRLKAMERDGQIMRNRRGKYAPVEELELIRGRVIGHRDGFGFLVPDDGSNDLFLSPYQMRALFPNDIVLARPSVNARGKREAIVVEILERNTQQTVGRFFKEGNIAFVQPHSRQITQDIVIPKGEEGKAKHGQYVALEMLTQPTARRQATGRIKEILGDHLTPGLEIEVAIRAHGLRCDWSAEVTREIRLLENLNKRSVTVSEKIETEKVNPGARLDLRHLPLVTIDGEDAKDFDDAVYCQPKARGGWKLIVAIADVSHYVAPDSSLDQEARLRGNSVYFPGRVIPMLPEVLSNELCSLKPHVDRLCLACELHINKAGVLTRYEFHEAIMYSHARLTYEEVSAMLNGKKQTNPALLPHLQALHVLYQQLHQQRVQRGALDFDSVETRIVFGKNKKIKAIVPVIRTEAHKMIEECMLIANVAAAHFLEKHQIPILYRVHEGPNPDKMRNVHDFLKSVGLKLTGGDQPKPIDYAKLLRRIVQRPDAHLIQTVLLRSMMQAVYSPDNLGHFGLAYEVYTHFTSPIRRYPDLLVHRAIRHVLAHKGKKKKPVSYDLATMTQLGEHCSMTERRADEATRSAVDWLKCHYMRDRLGQVFDGIISNVTGFGVFVELSQIYIEGLLHISALKSDYYHFDPAQHKLQGKRTGMSYRLGDQVRVMVARVDLEQREIDLELAS